MKSQPVFVVQALESRRLFALNLAAAVPGLPEGAFGDACPEVVAARTELRKDMVQMRADMRAGREQVQADRQAVVAELQKAHDDIPDLEQQLQPLRDKLADDRRACNLEVRQDETAIREKMHEFAPTIRTDKRAVRQAIASGDQTAIDAAKATLATDRATVDAAVKPLQDELTAHKTECKTTLDADRAAIEGKLAELDPAIQPLLDKLNADAKALDDKLAAERTEIQGDIDALRTAVQNCAAEHPEGQTASGDGTAEHPEDHPHLPPPPPPPPPAA